MIKAKLSIFKMQKKVCLVTLLNFVNRGLEQQQLGH